MTTNEALKLLLAARKKGEVKMLNTKFADGSDAGPASMVALAGLSGRLPFCSSLEDLLAAVESGMRMPLTRKVNRQAFIYWITKVVEDANKEALENASN